MIYDDTAKPLPNEIHARLDQKREELQAVRNDIQNAHENRAYARADNDHAFANYWLKYEYFLNARASRLEEEIRSLESSLLESNHHIN